MRTDWVLSLVCQIIRKHHLVVNAVVKKKNNLWLNEEAKTSFVKLKNIMITALILGLPNF